MTGMRPWLPWLAALVFTWSASAQTVDIGPGARWQSDGASIDFDCADVAVAGRLDVEDGMLSGIGRFANSGTVTSDAGAIEVGGDWINQGQFSAGTGSVHFSDRCDRPQATIASATTFATLDIGSDRGKLYRFAAGQTQSISTALRLTGAPGAHLVLRSTQPGAQSRLALANGAAQQIGWVDVADQAAPAGSQWLALGPPGQFNAIDSGNNTRWFGAPAEAQPVPAMSWWPLFALVLLVAGIAARRFRTC